MYLSTSALKQINFLFSSYVLSIFKVFLAQYSQFTNNSYADTVFLLILVYTCLLFTSLKLFADPNHMPLLERVE